jgi:hypothetical protein
VEFNLPGAGLQLRVSVSQVQVDSTAGGLTGHAVKIAYDCCLISGSLENRNRGREYRVGMRMSPENGAAGSQEYIQVPPGRRNICMNCWQMEIGEAPWLLKQPYPLPVGQFCCWIGCAALLIGGRLDVENPGLETSIDGAASSATTAYNLYFFIDLSKQ